MKILFILIFILSCSSSNSNNPQQKPLYNIYQSNSVEDLESYFERWVDSMPPEKEPTNEETRDAENILMTIFEKYWNPYDYSSWITEGRQPEVGHNINKDAKYLIVKSSFQYTVGNSEVLKHIHDFHPNFNFKDGDIVFASGSFYDGLKSLINDKSVERDEINKRITFLNKVTRIYYGHWFGFLVEAFPQVNHINFNNDLTEVKINFRIRYEGGEAIFKKENNDWVLKSSKLTWIE